MALQRPLHEGAGRFHLVHILQGLPPDIGDGLQFPGPIADQAFAAQKVFAQLAEYKMKLWWIGMNDHRAATAFVQDLFQVQRFFGGGEVPSLEHGGGDVYHQHMRTLPSLALHIQAGGLRQSAAVAEGPTDEQGSGVGCGHSLLRAQQAQTAEQQVMQALRRGFPAAFEKIFTCHSSYPQLLTLKSH